MLDQYELKANEVLKELEKTNFSFQAFESRYFQSYDVHKVASFINGIVEKLTEEKKYGTSDVYRDIRNRLTEFRRNINFEDIDSRFLEEFEAYLKGRGNATSSISVYLRTLRAVYNKAIASELIKAELYPFKRFKIKNGKAVKRALTKNDMLKIMNYKTENGTRLWHSHNFFVFSYLCRGMNLKDMAALKWKEHVLGDRIVYERAKTMNTKGSQEYHIIKIESEIKEILNNYLSNREYVFPIFEPGISELTMRHRIRGALKKISNDITALAKELNLDGVDRITHYWARHTYATALKRSGIQTSVISEALGHSSESTTKAYLDKFEQTEIDNTFQFLL